jgi:hypothetical protein
VLSFVPWGCGDGSHVASSDGGAAGSSAGGAGGGAGASGTKQSFLAQAAAGDYDGVFADSASPDLLQWEAQQPPEPRLAGTGARDTAIAELAGRTYITAWQDFVTQMNDALAGAGLALLPNPGRRGKARMGWRAVDSFHRLGRRAYVGNAVRSPSVSVQRSIRYCCHESV